ncbi:unnamed protein product [Arabidopsis thaliana]|uniref:(thale cress) hypothetical protein n=1 Tax=Arabidopsis thaliana TaxID=3702 RepID=A0A7G2DTH0_ARATH|nr:unnamed protein product [Arabidopsis thaliana]
MESSLPQVAALDRSTLLKAFDETKTGVKGLIDAGITEIPSIFRAPPATLTSPKPPYSSDFSIPTIDLKGGGTDSITRRSLVEKIRDAAEKWGFFQVINHGIPMDVLEKMIDGIREFHEQDTEVKKGFYSRDPASKMVYSSNFDLFSSPAANWRDTLGCYTAPDPPRPEDLPATCGEMMIEYSKEVMKLGKLLFELLSEALGLNTNHLKDMDCTNSLLLLGHYYPPCPQPDLTLGLTKHSDNSFLTILLQDHIGGLQVLHDQYWVDVPPVPGALVVNVGDLLQLITNDKFISVEHRVLANVAGPRISVACFFSSYLMANPRVYGPIKEILSEENPPNYRDTTITEYAKFYRSKGFDVSLSLRRPPPLEHRVRIWLASLLSFAFVHSFGFNGNLIFSDLRNVSCSYNFSPSLENSSNFELLRLGTVVYLYGCQKLLTCKTLVKLTLGTRLFLGKLPSYVSLPSLKFLFIHSVFFDDFGELSNVLLAGCPVVEALYLNQDGESMPYTISSPTLKRLSVHYEYHFESVISFDLPNLEYLDYSDYALYGYPQVNLESLVEAYLNLDKAEHVESPDVTKLIIGIRNVEILSLSPDSVGVIYSCCKYGLLLPVFNNLVSLSFGTKKTRAWKLLADILKQSPKLETLIIEDLNGYPLDVSMPLNQVKELQILEYGESDDEVKRLKSFLGEESMIEVVFPEV